MFETLPPAPVRRRWARVTTLVIGLTAVAATATVALTASPALADTPLAAPTNLEVMHVADTSADLDWSHDGLSEQDVVERQVNGVWQEYTRTNTDFLALTNLTRATTYTFRIYSIPFASLGYTPSARSATLSFTTLGAPDAVPPAKPGAPTFSSITTTTANVFWPQTTDNVQVTGYYLQQLIGGVWSTIRTVGPGQNFQGVNGLSAGSSYTYGVIAFDARGNVSPRSDPGVLTTLANTTGVTCKVQIITFNPGFMVTATIINSTPAPVSGWTIGFNVATTSTVSSMFGGTVSRVGTVGTLTPAVYYNTLNPGSQAMIGFNGTSTGPTYLPPTSFTVAGVPCTLT